MNEDTMEIPLARNSITNFGHGRERFFSSLAKFRRKGKKFCGLETFSHSASPLGGIWRMFKASDAPRVVNKK